MSVNLKERVWWGYVHDDIKELLLQTDLLLEVFVNWSEDEKYQGSKFHDWSFIVFPAAKAYEGFLKQLFLDNGLISRSDYEGKYFRVGKALNPALEKRYRKRESVYDRLVKYCGGKDTADALWNAWKSCRNLLFHWFPNEKNAIDYNEARQRFETILDAMDNVSKECKIN